MKILLLRLRLTMLSKSDWRANDWSPRDFYLLQRAADKGNLEVMK